MYILSALLFVVSATMDNLVVGIAYGIKHLKISFESNIMIGLISFVGTFFSMILGKFICGFLSLKAADSIGSFVLILLGTLCVISSLKERKSETSLSSAEQKQIIYYENLLQNPEKADTNHSGYIELKESLMLGLALAVNNMGLGIGIGIIGLNVWAVSILTLIFSLTAIPLGYTLGEKYLSKVFGSYAAIISGLIIIILGIYELLS